LEKNSSFLASKLNETVVTNYTRYQKSVKKKSLHYRRKVKTDVRSDTEKLKVQNVKIVSKLNTLMIEKLPI